jgi:aquaporin Z
MVERGPEPGADPGATAFAGEEPELAHNFLQELEQQTAARILDFQDPRQEWRRLFSEIVGTFFLVLVAAGGPMMAAGFDNAVGRAAAVAAPGVMVMSMIMYMGKVSGAHFNPAVSFAFALRGDFPWKRVPGYWAAQLVGAVAAAAFLQAVVEVSAANGANYPAESSTAFAAFLMETVLTFGLLSVILGTASGAQNIGIIGAIGVGGYIALAGLWASPLSGASMNPFRTLGPDIVANDYTSYWVYVAGPFLGAALAVLAALVLRGSGGGRIGSAAAQGSLFTRVERPGKP